jgi:hypothetical protein
MTYRRAAPTGLDPEIENNEERGRRQYYELHKLAFNNINKEWKRLCGNNHNSNHLDLMSPEFSVIINTVFSTLKIKNSGQWVPTDFQDHVSRVIFLVQKFLKNKIAAPQSKQPKLLAEIDRYRNLNDKKLQDPDCSWSSFKNQSDMLPGHTPRKIAFGMNLGTSLLIMPVVTLLLVAGVLTLTSGPGLMLLLMVAFFPHCADLLREAATTFKIASLKEQVDNSKNEIKESNLLDKPEINSEAEDTVQPPRDKQTILSLGNNSSLFPEFPRDGTAVRADAPPLLDAAAPRCR